MKTTEERKSILDKDIFRLVNRGWRIAHRSDTKCLLVRKKKANGCLLIFLLLLLVIPGIIYLFAYKGRSTLKIEVTEEGNIKYYPTGLSAFEQRELTWY
jgi:ribosomal protein S18